MKRAITALCMVLVLLFGGMMHVMAEPVNLLENGGFEQLNAQGEPTQWYPQAYRSQEGYSRIAVTNEKSHSGQYSAVIENASQNDARYICSVRVKPSSLYRLSGYVLVDSMEDTGNGANFGIEGIYAFSDCLYDTSSNWRYLEWYGETDEKQTELTFGVRVGGYSAESTGKAYFDDIVLEEVEELPKDVFASVWYDAHSGSSDAKVQDVSGAGEKNTLLFVIVAAVFAVACLWLSYIRPRGTSPFRWLGILVAFAAALLIRVILGMYIPGYEVDINCFTAWSMRMAAKGPAGFYAPDYFCDYPPGAMLLLWPIGAVLNRTGLQNAQAVLLLVKSLPILFDLLGAWVLYASAKKHTRPVTATVIASLYLLNPAVLVNGSAWGQMDSVLALCILLTTLRALKRDWKSTIPLFAVSALVKPQALLFAPLGLAWLICDWIRCRKSNELKRFWRSLGIGLGISAAAAAAIILPFSVGKEWNWLIELYAGTLSSYAYATLNTANLYYLIGANWTGLEQRGPALLMIAGTVLFAAGGSALLIEKNRAKLGLQKKKARVLGCLLLCMSVVQLLLWVLKADYALYGYAMMAFAYVLAIICMLFEKRDEALPFTMALALIGVYVLGVKVHERYLFPALPLLLLCYSISKDRRVLWLFAAFSATTFVNTAIVLGNSILFGSAQGHLNTDTLLLNRVLCLFNLTLCAFAGWIGLTGLKPAKEKTPVKTAKAVQENGLSSYEKMLLESRDHRLHLRWQDYVIMAGTALAYAVLAFGQLGSTVAPQTAWVSTSADEAVVLELEEETEFSVLYYAGVSYYDFSIQVSPDGLNWSESYPCEMREGLCYRWKYAVDSDVSNGDVRYKGDSPANVLWLQGKYLRINACNAGLNLWEVVARDRSGSNLPLKLVDHINARADLLNDSKPAENLIDEMNSCVGEPGWYNGTYFDEIYHARTGYEHLHGQNPYETTHPPLGKLFMSAGIALFGMTPFGWRFAGAFIGVLMLPALYLLCMQLTRKRSIAVISMLGLTFDLMHFTQTRIATIDSFPVFFILLSYLFMVRYMQMDFFAVSKAEHPTLIDRGFLKSLVPLFFSGVCMGLSIASKWIGMYSAVGLAVLFFLTVYRQYRVSATAWEVETNGMELTPMQAARVHGAQQFTLRRILITCACCVVFFVLIPCVIYCICYIPYLSPTGPVTLRRIYNAQVGMLNYHSTPGLGMDHPFQSPWWQWPFILKPMWFSQDHFEPSGYASTILCMGNPWIFYIGAFAMAAVLIACICKYVQVNRSGIVLKKGNGDLTLVILAIGFLAQYLPWVLVPRSMYIYHYFASVPFIIMATAWLLDHLTADRPRIRAAVFVVYILGAVVFFILFFPYASGRLTSTRWLDAMKWFKGIYY